MMLTSEKYMIPFGIFAISSGDVDCLFKYLVSLQNSSGCKKKTDLLRKIFSFEQAKGLPANVQINNLLQKVGTRVQRHTVIIRNKLYLSLFSQTPKPKVMIKGQAHEPQ
jgi:hypothetical protein